MKSKCLICSKKNNKSSVVLTEWIINYKDKAHTGKKVEIHTDCLSDRLYYEKPDGFIYGKVVSK
tara:strand:- start:858 stop:1049 length:192 start_codon:yes stop_codon:yes gene_type:complete